jgi:hypothetical protein
VVAEWRLIRDLEAVRRTSRQCGELVPMGIGSGAGLLMKHPAICPPPHEAANGPDPDRIQTVVAKCWVGIDSLLVG